MTCPKLPSWEVIENSQSRDPATHVGVEKQILCSDPQEEKERSLHQMRDSAWRKAGGAAAAAAVAAKSFQSCPSLCDPMDGSPPGPAVPGVL